MIAGPATAPAPAAERATPRAAERPPSAAAAPRPRGAGSTLAVLAALGVTAVPTGVVTAVALAAGGALRLGRRALGRGGTAVPRGRVLVTGARMTKALALARAFHGAGYEVVLVDTDRYALAPHRFSRAAAGFATVPDPRADPAGYTDALVALAERAGVTAFVPVPSPASAVLDAAAGERMGDGVAVVHPTEAETRVLDDKFAFCRHAADLGLPAPEVHRVTSEADVLGFDFADSGKRFVLKSIVYDPVARLEMLRLPCADMDARVRGLPISEERPWVLQELVEGEEFCTHGTARDGRLTLFCCSRSSPFQVNYEHVEHPVIERWSREYVERSGVTGQVSFDFIEAADGRVLPIECNPRTHSAIAAFERGVADAYLGEVAATGCATPDPGARPAHWIAHELGRLARARDLASVARVLRTIARGRDAVFRWSDPLPFFALHHVFVPWLLVKSLVRGRRWLRIDFNIGKLVEAGGD
ncbi:MAG: ATP-grasp enzyme [Planctomycetota bacterium]